MAEEPRHSDVDDVDIDDDVQEAVHDGPLDASKLDDPGDTPGKSGTSGTASDSTMTGTTSPDE